MSGRRRITALKPEFEEMPLLISHHSQKHEDAVPYRDWFLGGMTALQWCLRFQPAPLEPSLAWLEKNYRRHFHEESYLIANPDVQEAVRAGKFSDGWTHFTSHGCREGRVLNVEHFDESGYLLFHPDVAEAVGKGEIASGWVHLQSTGIGEMRVAPIHGFCNERYLGLYPEVGQVVWDGYFKSPYHHYLFFGQKNGYLYTVTE